MKNGIETKQKYKGIIYLIKSILRCVLIISMIFEFIFFPSLETLLGVMMMTISYLIFVGIFLNEKTIVEYPFAFMMFLSMFMYRFLPVPTTLIERKPVSYGMEVPIKTFFLETILFLISSFAFYCATRQNKHNNFLQKIFKSIGLYEAGNTVSLWLLGIIGCLARILTFSMGDIEIGNVGGKFLATLVNFMYVPVILFFPIFYKKKSEKKVNFKQPLLWVYLILISILNLAANSRNSLVIPLATIALMYILYLCVNKEHINKFLNSKKSIPLIIIAYLCLHLLSIASDAILLTRNIRNNVNFTELIELTYKNMITSNSQYSEKINTDKLTTYAQGWTETYLENYMLNRYANMRITDETLYLGDCLNNQTRRIMRKDFFNRIIVYLPQPIINILGFNIDKNNYQNSRGDALYVYSGIGSSYNWGGYRVTSHLGDGLITFGVLYFPIQFIMFFIVFKLLNCYSYYDKKYGTIYSIYGLISLYSCLNMFGNANGMLSDIGFCIRGYWQNIMLFIVLFGLIQFVSNIKIRKY